MTRLVIDATAAGSSGAGSRLAELADALPLLAPGHDHLFVVAPGASRSLRARPGTRVWSTPPSTRRVPVRLAWEQLRLPRLLAETGADWVLSPFNVLPLGPGLPSRTRTALIVSNIGPFAPEALGGAGGYQGARNRALRVLTLASIRRADVVFLLSREAGRLLGPVVPAGKRVLLPMAPPAPDVLETALRTRVEPFGPGIRWFTVVGDLYPYKGVEDAVRAVGTLRRSGTPAGLVICGHRMDRRYAERLRRLAAREAPGMVRFTGRLERADVLALMAGAVATLACSRLENPNRVPVEAMAVGAPVVAADVAVAHETCGRAALYYPPGDHTALADAMRGLMADPARRQRLVLLGRARVATTDWLCATRAILDALGIPARGRREDVA